MTIPWNKLIKTAKSSPHYKCQHATLVFRGGSLISAGYNHDGIHSEVNAIEDIWPNRRHNLSIVNIMMKTKSGNFGVSRPCQKCLVYLRANKIRKITWFDGLEFKEERL